MKLDKLGVKHEHLPNTPPFSIYLDLSSNGKKSPASEGADAPKESITNQKLLEAIGSVDAFDKMYMVCLLLLQGNGN